VRSATRGEITRTLPVFRSTVSGIDHASVQRVLTQLRTRYTGDLGFAFLDGDEPTIHVELDRASGEGIREVQLIPVAVPRDRYFDIWVGGTVGNWRETRSPQTQALAITLVDCLGPRRRCGPDNPPHGRTEPGKHRLPSRIPQPRPVF
jgi:hypothetical protein